MSRPIVAFARGCLLFPAARALVEEHAEAVDEDRVGEAAALYVDSFSPPKIDAAYLDRAPHLRMICSATAGYDNIDVVECTRRGIAVSNSQGSLTEAVADIALLHIIAAFRHIGEGVQWARSGKWLDKPMAVGDDVGGHTLGIIGLGAIGMAVAKRANACGMDIIYHNRNRRADDVDVAARYVPFDELLRTAKCVVVLIPLNAETRGMFGAREFGLMRDAYFVNASRGAIVETDALVDALTAKTLAGAALDVTDPEPLPPGHALFSLQNVFITPHIGTATKQTRERMTVYAAQNIVAGLSGSRLPQIVNPDVYA
jgi:glyoxylate reductase